MRINVNDIELYYEVLGQGRPLILLHGNGEDHTIFDEAVQILAHHFTCYLIDSRGHGASTPVKSFSYEQMAEDVIAFVDALGLRKSMLYGFSDGGIIGLLVAIRRPELLSRLIVSGANIEPKGVKARIYWQLRLVTLFRKDPLLLLMVKQPHITPQELAQITVPTLVLAGSGDLIREKHTRMIAESIPGAELRILPGEDHGSYIVHNQKIAEIILSATED